jgi:hypothetical protein
MKVLQSALRRLSVITLSVIVMLVTVFGVAPVVQSATGGDDSFAISAYAADDKASFKKLYGSTTEENVKLYAKADSKSKVLVAMKLGRTITVTGEKGKYYKASYQQYTGYFLKKYFKKTDEVR